MYHPSSDATAPQQYFTGPDARVQSREYSLRKGAYDNVGPGSAAFTLVADEPHHVGFH